MKQNILLVVLLGIFIFLISSLVIIAQTQTLDTETILNGYEKKIEGQDFTNLLFLLRRNVCWSELQTGNRQWSGKQLQFHQILKESMSLLPGLRALVQAPDLRNLMLK